MSTCVATYKFTQVELKLNLLEFRQHANQREMMRRTRFRAERLQYLFFGGVFARSVCRLFLRASLARGASAQILCQNRSRRALALIFGGSGPVRAKMGFRLERLEFSIFWIRVRAQRLENSILG